MSFDGTTMEYEFTSNKSFQINNTIEDLDEFYITYFDIETCTKTDLVLVSQIEIEIDLIDFPVPLPPNSKIPGKLTVSCTK